MTEPFNRSMQIILLQIFKNLLQYDEKTGSDNKRNKKSR